MVKKVMIIAMSLLSSSTYPNVIENIYTKIFGPEDLKKTYKIEITNQLKAMGVKNPEQINLKKANCSGSTIAGIDISSFTAAPFGIWFDEESLDLLNSDEREWSIAHECSHYAKNHHPKLIASGLGLGSSIILALYLFYKRALTEISTKKKVGVIVASGIIGIVLFIKALQSMVKKQEKEADIFAARALINAGQEHTVLNQINNLKKFYNENANYWWPSVSEQIKYLEEELKSNNSNKKSSF